MNPIFEYGGMLIVLLGAAWWLLYVTSGLRPRRRR